MRAFLYLWLLPVSGFWSWHLLARDDIVFSRALHDEVFTLYGSILGMDPATLPDKLARTLLFDGVLLLSIIAFRRRKKIAAFARILLARWRAAPQRAEIRSSTP